jgi:hypothetical protein
MKESIVKLITNVVVLLNLLGSAKNVDLLKMHTNLADHKLTITQAINCNMVTYHFFFSEYCIAQYFFQVELKNYPVLLLFE